MLRLTEKLSKEKHCPVYFIVADSDLRSQPKVAASSVRVSRKPLACRPILTCTIPACAQLALQPTEWVTVPRSREVGQSWSSSVLTTAYSLAFSTCVMLRMRPQVVICNGPGVLVGGFMGWASVVAHRLYVLERRVSLARPRDLLAHMLRGVCSSRPRYRTLTHHFCGELLSGLFALADRETAISHR